MLYKGNYEPIDYLFKTIRLVNKRTLNITYRPTRSEVRYNQTVKWFV